MVTGGVKLFVLDIVGETVTLALREGVTDTVLEMEPVTLLVTDCVAVNDTVAVAVQLADSLLDMLGETVVLPDREGVTLTVFDTLGDTDAVTV